MSEDKPGRRRRLGRLARSIAGATARRLFTSKERADTLLGDALFEHLDQMKGMAMKVGQILSYMDGAIPEHTQHRLRRLQVGVDPVGFDVIAEVIEEELGSLDVFDHLDRDAVAAASIGQVHRGDVDGQPVAVKVQYPDIRESFEADTEVLHRIAALASMATHTDGAALVEELHDRLLEECDYRHEARMQEQFAEWFREDPDLVVPDVLATHSTDRVLTTHWWSGLGFYDFVEATAPEERHRAALALLRFTWISFLQHHTLHVDPHPGNYLFLDDGRVVVLDYGCIRTFDDDFWTDATHILRAVIDGDRDAHDDAARALGFATHPRFDFDMWWRLMRWQYRPYIEPRFVFTAEYVAEVQEYNGLRNARSMARVALPPQWIWVMRQTVGLHAVLARLGAAGDFHTPMRKWLDDVS